MRDLTQKQLVTSSHAPYLRTIRHLGEEKKMEMAVPLTKEIMMSFEEKSNGDKEERMVFGGGEEGKTRMLGCLMGAAEDIKQRIARAVKTWFKVKKQLTRSQLPKTSQARKLQACVENALLFDCNTCVWCKKDVKKLQSWVDR